MLKAYKINIFAFCSLESAEYLQDSQEPFFSQRKIWRMSVQILTEGIKSYNGDTGHNSTVG